MSRNCSLTCCARHRGLRLRPSAGADERPLWSVANPTSLGRVTCAVEKVDVRAAHFTACPRSGQEPAERFATIRPNCAAIDGGAREQDTTEEFLSLHISKVRCHLRMGEHRRILSMRLCFERKLEVLFGGEDRISPTGRCGCTQCTRSKCKCGQWFLWRTAKPTDGDMHVCHSNSFAMSAAPNTPKTAKSIVRKALAEIRSRIFAPKYMPARAHASAVAPSTLDSACHEVLHPSDAPSATVHTVNESPSACTILSFSNGSI